MSMTLNDPKDQWAQRSSVIEVYADVWCPFAHVGLHYVVERRSALARGDVLLDIRAWPLELVNGAPLDPDITASHVRELRSQVAPHLFGGFNPKHFPTTSLPALACVHAAYRQDLKTGEAMSLALRDALFEEGLDISRPEVLSDLPNHSMLVYMALPTRRRYAETGKMGFDGASEGLHISTAETLMPSVRPSTSREVWTEH